MQLCNNSLSGETFSYAGKCIYNMQEYIPATKGRSYQHLEQHTLVFEHLDPVGDKTLYRWQCETYIFIFTQFSLTSTSTCTSTSSSTITNKTYKHKPAPPSTPQPAETSLCLVPGDVAVARHFAQLVPGRGTACHQTFKLLCH